MFIYKISNYINDKVYIGQTIRPIEERFKRHINDAINNVLDTHFARAIRKYGKENFYIEKIDDANSQEELNLKEQYRIRYFDSINNGYNETDALYKCGGNTYKSKSKEEMQLISQRISKTKLKGNNPNSKSIKCRNVDTKEELFFDSAIDCRDYFEEKTHRFITTRVLHNTKSLYKSVWEISYANEDYYQFERKVDKKGTSLSVVDIETNLETIFKSIRLASRELNINRNQITKHIKNNENIFIINNYKFTILN
jgi:group I intron endonuclease